MLQQYKVGLIIIDYLQLMDATSGDNRTGELTKITRKVKLTAKELNIPIILLSQLSRASELRGGTKRPELSDLRESGSIEQDADTVMFTHRPEYYGQMVYEDGHRFAGDSTENMVEIIVKKQRNGPVFTEYLRFEKDHGGFYELVKEDVWHGQ